jgi:opacity protein-like surface antigen
MKAKFTNLFNPLLIIGFILLANTSIAQRVRAVTSTGFTYYHGDLTNSSKVFGKVNFNLGASYDFQNQLRARLNLGFYGLQGADGTSKRKDIQDRALSFKTSVTEIAALIEYDFLSNETYAIVPYIFGGPGVYFFKPKGIDPLTGETVDLHSIGTEGQNLPGNPFPERKYSTTQINLQLGLGVRYEVNDQLSVGFEFSTRKLFTDYLDDVSENTGYLDPSYVTSLIGQNGFSAADALRVLSFNNPNNQPTYLPRGHAEKKDMFVTFQLRVNYRLDFINWGGETDFYGNSGSSYRNRSRLRNPKNIF